MALCSSPCTHNHKPQFKEQFSNACCNISTLIGWNWSLSFICLHVNWNIRWAFLRFGMITSSTTKERSYWSQVYRGKFWTKLSQASAPIQTQMCSYISTTKLDTHSNGTGSRPQTWSNLSQKGLSNLRPQSSYST